MKQKLSLIAGGLLVAMLGLSGQAMANDEVEKRAADPNQWGAPGRDNKLTRHSPLADINTGNVGKAADGLVAVDRRSARSRGTARRDR